MRVSIIVPNKRVSVDGTGVKLKDFDWAPYADIRAVQGWLDRDRAEVEFKEIDPDGDGPLPSYKPPNKLISKAEFDALFGPILTAYAAADKTPRKPQPQPSDNTAPAKPQPVPPQVDVLIQTMAGELDALKAKVQALDEQNTELLRKLAGAS